MKDRRDVNINSQSTILFSLLRHTNAGEEEQESLLHRRRCCDIHTEVFFFVFDFFFILNLCRGFKDLGFCAGTTQLRCSLYFRKWRITLNRRLIGSSWWRKVRLGFLTPGSIKCYGGTWRIAILCLKTSKMGLNLWSV